MQTCVIKFRYNFTTYCYFFFHEFKSSVAKITEFVVEILRLIYIDSIFYI